jgi:hypothetical protein
MHHGAKQHTLVFLFMPFDHLIQQNVFTVLSTPYMFSSDNVISLLCIHQTNETYLACLQLRLLHLILTSDSTSHVFNDKSLGNHIFSPLKAVFNR